MIFLAAYPPTELTLGFELVDYTIPEPDGPLEVCLTVQSGNTIGTMVSGIALQYTDGTANGKTHPVSLTVAIFTRVYIHNLKSHY